MHEKHAGEGLAVISVALDGVDEPGIKEGILKFLKDKKAGFTNVLLNESAEFWQEKFRFPAPPSYYVFSRQGRWTQFKADDDNGVNYEALDKLIVQWLREKVPNDQ